MEWAKLSLDFIVEIIHYAIWPVVFLAILIIYRKSITAVIQKGLKIALGDSVKIEIPTDLQEKVEEIQAAPKGKDKDFAKNLFLKQLEITAIYAGVIALGETGIIKAFQERAKVSFENALKLLEEEEVKSKSLKHLHVWATRMKSS